MNLSINVEVPKSRKEIIKQIAALEYALEHDISEKDRKIHSQALEALKKALERR